MNCFSYGMCTVLLKLHIIHIHILQFRHKKLDCRVGIVSTINYCYPSDQPHFRRRMVRWCLQSEIRIKQWFVNANLCECKFFNNYSFSESQMRQFCRLTNSSRWKSISSLKMILFEKSSLFLKYCSTMKMHCSFVAF